VRDHDERLAVVLHGAAQEVENLAARLRVEVPRRLVREDHGRPAHECARDRHALLLSAGQLRGTMRPPVLQADLRQQVVEEGRIRLRAGERERQEDVLLRAQHRQEVEELEHEADVVAPQLRHLRVAQLAEARAGDRHVAGRRPVERGEDVHQGRLAGA
jgi:hypothetical protein